MRRVHEITAFAHGLSVGDYIDVSGKIGVGRVTGLCGSTVILFEPLTLWEKIKLRVRSWWRAPRRLTAP